MINSYYKSSKTRDKKSPPSDDDVLSISGSLLDDVHIDFGQEEEEEEEDSVFDQNLMQYLAQLPIAGPPADANYSASFVDSVLNDVETFKREVLSRNYDAHGPSINLLYDLSSSKSEAAYPLEQDGFSIAAVEQPRGEHVHWRQEQEEIPLHFYNDHSPVIQPSSSIDHSTEYSDYLDLFNLGQDQPNDNEPEAALLAQRKAELDALFDLNQDDSKDFSSWLYYSDDEASQVHSKDDMPQPPPPTTTTSAFHPEKNYHHTFSPEYPFESDKHDAFTTADFPVEQGYVNPSRVVPPSQPDFGYSNASHHDFLQRLQAIATENMPQPVSNDPFDHHNNKPSATIAKPATHAKPHTPRLSRRNFSVNISKADFMCVSSSSSSKHSSNLSDIHEEIEPDDSFVHAIASTSTPVKKKHKNVAEKQRMGSRLPINSNKRRSTVLEEVNKNAPVPTTTSSSPSSHHYSMRARPGPSAIRKTYSKPMKSSHTFKLSSRKKR